MLELVMAKQVLMMVFHFEMQKIDLKISFLIIRKVWPFEFYDYSKFRIPRTHRINRSML